jgi:hypothetical protein
MQFTETERVYVQKGTILSLPTDSHRHGTVAVSVGLRAAAAGSDPGSGQCRQAKPTPPPGAQRGAGHCRGRTGLPAWGPCGVGRHPPPATRCQARRRGHAGGRLRATGRGSRPRRRGHWPRSRTGALLARRGHSGAQERWHRRQLAGTRPPPMGRPPSTDGQDRPRQPPCARLPLANTLTISVCPFSTATLLATVPLARVQDSPVTGGDTARAETAVPKATNSLTVNLMGSEKMESTIWKIRIAAVTSI